eukprot:GHVU01056378.1.p2 GENE.GHVU01056378.1~~GHVU01056378.1.p2  ORF type:complete len:101 (+),score=3.04 GHVU01056378.1:287-589(+)
MDGWVEVWVLDDVHSSLRLGSSSLSGAVWERARMGGWVYEYRIYTDMRVEARSRMLSGRLSSLVCFCECVCVVRVYVLFVSVCVCLLRVWALVWGGRSRV